jgi:O-antigen chain-terminating methyltransferase
VDIGCGRGEFLAALASAGIGARGVDSNGEMVAAATSRGLDVVQADALAWVEALPPGSIGGAIATQVVEHLEPQYLLRLLDALARALRPNAPLVFETINPACWLAFFSSYIRDFTHVRPIHPETLQYLLRAHGFVNVSLEYSAPVPEEVKMKPVDLPADVLSSPNPLAVAMVRVAQTANANAAILNNLMFTHLDYAAIGYRD